MKAKILNILKEIVNSRIEITKTAIEAVQQSANNEGKSSAGDKYETGRAMAQIEKDLYTRQLLNAINEKAILDRIDSDIKPILVGLGSLVSTNNAKYFISVSIGEINVEGEIIFAVSANSPFGALLLGKKVDESFQFQNKTQTIKNIF